MRLLMLATFLGAALFAQTPPPPDQTPKADDPPATAQTGKDKTAESEALRPQVLELSARQEALRKFLQGHPNSVYVEAPPIAKVTLAPGQACAVPLTNLMRPVKPAPMPSHVPSGHYPIKEVPLPAPSCDDVK